MSSIAPDSAQRLGALDHPTMPQREARERQRLSLQAQTHRPDLTSEQLAVAHLLAAGGRAVVS